MTTEDIPTYTSAVDEYLKVATWVSPAEAPYVVQLRQVARSLDKQLVDKGEVQSALAGTFTKTMQQLDRQKPPPPPDPMAGQIPGQTNLLEPQFG